MADRIAQVVLAKCSQTGKLYGITMEKRGNKWVEVWAFKIDERDVQKENFATEAVSGEIEIGSEYPGCPYCGKMGWCACDQCGKLTCWEGAPTSTCGFCGATGQVIGATRFDLRGGGF